MDHQFYQIEYKLDLPFQNRAMLSVRLIGIDLFILFRSYGEFEIRTDWSLV
jgi:hypothetical protein